MRSPARVVALVLTLLPLLCPVSAFAQAPGAPSVGPGVSPAGPPGPPAPVSEASSPQTQAPAAQPAIVPVTVGALWYLSAQDSTTDVSRFTIKRGYINIETKVLSFMSARITPDVTQDASGDLKVRLKYAYAKFAASDLGFITHPEIEVGVTHTPWLDFEEHVNLFRLQDTMFVERNGLFNSADTGVTFMALLGGPIAKEYQDTVSKAYPGRYGSFAVGVYNGGGYHAAEKNDNKVVEGRLTLRLLPDVAPGFQVSYFGVRGRGNTPAEAPDWRVDGLMASYESRFGVLTAQQVWATGNQKGSDVDPDGRALDQDGWSVFGEARLAPRWSLIGRVDRFDPDERGVLDVRTRTIGGVAFQLGKGNMVLLDYDRVDFDLAGKETEKRVQVTLQVKY
jgi:hypothetical protein